MIRKRGKSYQAIVYIKGKVAASKTFKKRDAAKRWEAETTAKLVSDPDVYENGRMTLQLFWQIYLERHLSTLSENSQARYLLEAEKRILVAFGCRQIGKITTAEIELWKLEQRKAERKNKSINITIQTFRSILQKAVKWKYLVSNPATDVELLPLSVEPRDWLQTEEEIAAVIAQAQGSRYYPMILLALEAGLRQGEILGLQAGDFDFEAGQIRVERQWLDRSQKFGPPKHRIRRYVPMSEGIRTTTLDRLATSLPKALVFTSSNGAPPRQSSIYDAITEITEKAIGRKLGLHAFRHSFGSWYMRIHDDMWTLSRLMGHSNIETTRKYCHTSQNHKAPALNLVTCQPPAKSEVGDGKNLVRLAGYLGARGET